MHRRKLGNPARFGSVSSLTPMPCSIRARCVGSGFSQHSETASTLLGLLGSLRKRISTKGNAGNEGNTAGVFATHYGECRRQGPAQNPGSHGKETGKACEPRDSRQTSEEARAG